MPYTEEKSKIWVLPASSVCLKAQSDFKWAQAESSSTDRAFCFQEREIRGIFIFLMVQKAEIQSQAYLILL